MTKFDNLILVSGAPAKSGLPYYYYLALNDVSDMRVHLVDNGQVQYEQTLIRRLRRKILGETGLSSRFQFQNIIKLVGKNHAKTAIIIFNLAYLGKNEIIELEKRGVCLYLYLPDSIFGMSPNTRQIVMEVLPTFKCVFTPLIDLIPVYYQYGAKHVHRIPFAYCKYTHLIEGSNFQPPDGRLYYFGTYGPIIEKWLRPLVDFNLEIHGHDWNKARLERVKSRAKYPVAIDQLMAKKANGQLVINFMRTQHGACHSMKTFELPAAGACIISNRTAEQIEFFPEESNISYFNTAEEMKSLVKWYLNNPLEISKEIGKRQKYLINNSYHERASIFLDLIEQTA
jgi:hypothetical protein